MTRLDWSRPHRDRMMDKPPLADLIRWRRITLRFPSRCAFCRGKMKKGHKAAYEPESRSTACIGCAEDHGL